MYFYSSDFASRHWQMSCTRRGSVQTTPHRTHECAYFSRCVSLFALFIECTCIGSRCLSDSVCLSKIIPSAHHVTPGCSWVLCFPSCLVFVCSAADTAGWNQTKPPCTTPLWGGPSGHLADPIPNTDYEPKFCIDVSSELTPINLPSRKSSFNLENDATIAASEGFDLLQHSGASGSRHSVASTVPTLLKLGSSSTRKLVVDCDSVASLLSSTRNVVADHETVVSVEESVSRGKRDRDLNVVQTLKDIHSVHKFLERKAELAVQERSQLRKDYLKLKQKWSEIGKREILILLFMRLIKNWSLNDWSYSRRTNGLNRLKEWRIHCGEMEMRNRFFCRNSRKILPRSWRVAKKTDRAGHARIDDLSTHQKRDPAAMSQLLTQIPQLQTESIPCQMRENFSRSWNSEQLWSVPRSFVNPWLFRVPEQCHAAILTFLNDCLLEKDHPQLSSKIQRIWHHLLADLDLTLQEIRWYRKVKWDGNRRIRQCLYHATKEEVESLIILVELILTVGRWVTRDFQSRKCIWENSQTLEFQCWKINFKTEVCSKTADPNLTMHWIKEVEIAKSFDELVTSRSITVRTDFPHYDMLDATIASALKKLLDTHVHFRKKSKCRRATRSNIRPILTSETNCLHDPRTFSCNRSLWSSTRTLRFVQYTHAEWRRARFRRSMGPSSIISKRNSNGNDPGKIVQVKLAGFCSASDCVGFVRPRNCSKRGTTE